MSPKCALTLPNNTLILQADNLVSDFHRVDRACITQLMRQIGTKHTIYYYVWRERFPVFVSDMLHLNKQQLKHGHCYKDCAHVAHNGDENQLSVIEWNTLQKEQNVLHLRCTTLVSTLA